MANGDDNSIQDQPQPAAASVPGDVMAGLVGAEGLASQGMSQPIQTVPSELTSTIAPVTPPNPGEVQVHEHVGFMRNILDHVANIMGGGETYHVTKDPDGNVSIDKGPATTGEKWGRIAAAALGGAASGLAQQGVNAPARSVAAGFQMGQQIAQAPLQRAREEAEQQQQLTLRNAQLARIHQQIAEAQFNQRLAPIREARLEAQEALNFRNAVEDDGGTDYGTYSNEQEMRDMASAHPELVNYHLGQGGQILKVPQADGTTRVYGLPADAGGRRLTEPRKYPALINVDSKGNVTPGEAQTAPKGMKTTEYWQNVQSIVAKNLQAENIASQIRQRAERGPARHPLSVTTTAGPMWAYEPTAEEPGGRLVPMAKPGQPTVTGLLRATPRPTEGANLSPEDLDSAVRALADISSGARLETFPIKQRTAILTEMGRRGLSLAHPLTPREIDRADLANNAVNNLDEAIRILDEHPEMFGPLGKGRVTFQQLLQGGNANATAFKAAVDAANFPVLGIHGFRSRYGLAKLDQLDSDFYTNAEATRAALMELRRSSMEFGRMGGRVPAVGQSGSQSPPTMGGNTAPAPAAQPGGTVAVQIPGQPPGHIPRERLDEFRRLHPDATIGP